MSQPSIISDEPPPNTRGSGAPFNLIVGVDIVANRRANSHIMRTNEHMNPEMPPEALVDLLQLFEGAGIEVWLDGGWAVDALLGMQTRPHKDVDIILRVADLPRLRDILGSRGFEIQHGGTESNFVLADYSGAAPGPLRH